MKPGNRLVLVTKNGAKSCRTLVLKDEGRNIGV